MPPPAQINSTLATDESVWIRSAGDYPVLCPASQKLAYGTDGVIDSNAWTLTSASVNFATNGVAANNVVLLDRPASTFPGAGEWFAVESAAAGVLTIRRMGLDAETGQPPPTASGVQFTVYTFSPQLEEASFELYQKFSLDDNIPNRAPTDAYDLRVLRKACVLIVLKARYLQQARDHSGDFWGKYQEIKRELDDTLEVIRIRWGTDGESQPTTSIFGMRCER